MTTQTKTAGRFFIKADSDIFLDKKLSHTAWRVYATLEEAAGASRVVYKPLDKLQNRLGINEDQALAALHILSTFPNDAPYIAEFPDGKLRVRPQPQRFLRAHTWLINCRLPDWKKRIFFAIQAAPKKKGRSPINISRLMTECSVPKAHKGTRQDVKNGIWSAIHEFEQLGIFSDVTARKGHPATCIVEQERMDDIAGAFLDAPAIELSEAVSRTARTPRLRPLIVGSDKATGKGGSYTGVNRPATPPPGLCDPTSQGTATPPPGLCDPTRYVTDPKSPSERVPLESPGTAPQREPTPEGAINRTESPSPVTLADRLRAKLLSLQTDGFPEEPYRPLLGTGSPDTDIDRDGPEAPEDYPDTKEVPSVAGTAHPLEETEVRPGWGNLTKREVDALLARLDDMILALRDPVAAWSDTHRRTAIVFMRLVEEAAPSLQVRMTRAKNRSSHYVRPLIAAVQALPEEVTARDLVAGIRSKADMDEPAWPVLLGERVWSGIVEAAEGVAGNRLARELGIDFRGTSAIAGVRRYRAGQTDRAGNPIR
jgi:hypothetical protein